MKENPDAQHPSTLDECRRCDVWRNATQPVERDGRWIVATCHPAYALCVPSSEALREAKCLL